MANRNYIILEDKDGKEVLPVTDGNGVFVEGGTKKLESKLTEIDSKTTELNEQLDTNTQKLSDISYYVTPEMFGAKGDGISDDYTAFQSAFNSGYNVICGKEKKYNLIGGIINVGTSNRKLDLNGSTIIDACFSFNLNDNLTDWESAYSASCFHVLNGIIGTEHKTRMHEKPCVFLTGGYLRLENLTVYKTPHLVAHAMRFIDHFEMTNILNNKWCESVDDYKGLDCVNVINRETGVIQKVTDRVYCQGDGWLFTKVNEFNTNIVDNYALVTLNFHQSVKFTLCIQTSVNIGVRNVAVFEGCHYEQVNTCPKFSTNYLIDSNITFLGCSFISNYTILDEICVNYVNCKFHLGYEVPYRWNDVFSKRLIEYSCRFMNCNSHEYGLIDNYKMYNVWNTPICCNMNDYYLSELKKMSFKEIISNNYVGYDDEVGEYNITAYIHLSNDLTVAYHKVTTTINKTVKNSAIAINSFPLNGGIIEVYLTYPNGEIKVGWLKISNIDNATKLGKVNCRYNSVVITNGLISLRNDNPKDVIYDSLVTVNEVPERTISTDISKF